MERIQGMLEKDPQSEEESHIPMKLDVVPGMMIIACRKNAIIPQRVISCMKVFNENL